MKFPPILFLTAGLLPAQVAVPVGEGSYASFPPAHEGVSSFVNDSPLYVSPGETRPIPTNDWWTDLISSQYSGDLWAYPLVVDPGAAGYEVKFPKGFNPDGTAMVQGRALQIGGVGFQPSSAIAKDWTDWTVVARMESSGKAIDATLAHGSPFVWFETSGLVPTLGVPDGSTLSDGAGGPIEFPFTGNRFLVSFDDRNLGIHLPPGTVCARDQNEFLQLDFGSDKSVTRVSIDWEAAYAKSYRVQISPDGQSWTDLASVTNGDGGNDDLTGLSGQGRYLRLLLEERGTQYPFSLFEIRAFNGTVNLSTGAIASASSVQAGGHVAANAIDGNGGTRWAASHESSERISFDFPENDGYLVVSALPASTDFAAFDNFARNIPRDTRVDYDHDAAAGTLTVDWTVTTENLDGAEAGDTLQGFLPHHTRDAEFSFALDQGGYRTARGNLGLAAGRSFEFVYPFTGLVPHLNAPVRDPDDSASYDANLLAGYVTRFANRAGYGNDTYFGGKDLTKLAHHTLIAAETDHPSLPLLKQKTRDALVNWLTYTPGETEHYYARYPRHKALVGFNESFGSKEFTDHHFHYGYLVHACALYAMVDPDFLTDYGDMVKLVLREYADWQRGAEDFPWMRTFDPWMGHSYAAGKSSPGSSGNNQESTSEAIQSWVGMYHLAGMLEDEEMRDAAAFGYLSEVRATLEYWFDWEDEIWSPDYDKSVVGILFNGHQAYATYFSGSPVHIHAIQYIPITPASNYFARKPAWALQEYDALLTEAASADGFDDESDYGGEWCQLALGMRLQWDPEYVTAKLKAYDAGRNGVLNDDLTAQTYYFAHAQQNLGVASFQHYTDLPMGTVYEKDGQLSATVYNPSATSKVCHIRELDGTVVKTFTVPARSLITYPEPEGEPETPPSTGFLPNWNFELPGGESWQGLSGAGSFVFDYPATEGNPGGCAVIDHSANDGGWGLIVSGGNTILALDELGLAAGGTYEFQQDMRILSGSNIGGLKVEYYRADGSLISQTSDMHLPRQGDGSQWATYSFAVTIPADAEGIKVVPLWGAGSVVAIDNVRLGPPRDFASWIAEFAVGALDQFTDDADGDGIANGLENFFGTDPSVPSPGLKAVLVESESGNDSFVFHHPINEDPVENLSAATYMWSKDLTTFYGDGEIDPGGTRVDFFHQDQVPEAGMRAVVATITGERPGQIFVRVGVSLL